MQNIIMGGTGVYIPKHKVYNEELEEHFQKRGLSAQALMEHLGRRKRYFIEEGENTITMSQNAINDYVNKHNIRLEEIEMLIVCTDTPEYLFPSNAMKIVGLYGEQLKNVKVAFDLNSNCSGLIQGLDVVTKYMRGSEIKKALVIGCFCISPIALWSDTVVYATFGDAAVCVALESEESEEKRGFLDENVSVDASYHDYITYPKCGMSNAPLKKIEPNQKRLEWNPFPMDFIVGKWVQMINEVLKRNNLEPNNIDYYIFSQLSDAFNLQTLEMLGVPESKYYFVGKEYGYTGNTCTIVCLNRMWEIYAKRGNKIIICTVGAGYSAIVLLYEF